jgi:hypothetical protein
MSRQEEDIFTPISAAFLASSRDARSQARRAEAALLVSQAAVGEEAGGRASKLAMQAKMTAIARPELARSAG